MTDGDMTREMGETLKQLADQRKRLACLHTRSERMISHLAAARTRFEGANRGNWNVQYHDALAEDLWPSFSDMRDTIAEMEDASGQVEKLNARLREWGAIK